MKKIILYLVFVIYFFVFAVAAHAADYDITCTDSGCTPSTITGFFPSTETWYPGKTYTKTIRITNNSAIGQKIGTEALNETVSGNLDQVIQFTIQRQDTTNAWDNSLHAFYSNGETQILDNLSSGSSHSFAFTGLMYSTADNNYQNKTTQFDMTIGFISSPTPTTTPCTDTKPASPGPLSLTRINNTEVKAIWGAASDPVTGYRISWSKDTDIDGDGDGTKSVGKTTETNITGLNLTSYTYYFKVRAVNGCKEGDTTGIATVGDGPNYLVLTSTPTPTPTSEVTPPVPTPTPTGEVQGITTNNLQFPQKEIMGATTQKCNCIWWQILLGEMILAALYYFRFAKNMSGKKPKIVGLLIAVATFIVFRFFNKCFTYSFFLFPNTPSIFCRYFILMDVLTVITLMLLRMRQQNRYDNNYDKSPQ